MTRSVEREPASAAVDAPVPGGAHYRPHLDGLRAIAVYLVVLFHAGSTWFSGGYVGVDVFFVLSGFLVTQLLLRDLAEQGKIRFGRFYARRYRRLLPAAFVTLIVTAMIYSAIASPGDVIASINGFKAAFLYVANWFFIRRSTAYFGGDINQNPVLQFWSLAVEEQFYMLWPLLLAGLFAWTGRRKDRQLATIRVCIAAAAFASLAWALWLRTGSPEHAYFGTETRAYELLAGALLALTPGFIARVGSSLRRTRLMSVASIAVLFVIASDWIHVDAIVRGLLATVATVVFLVAIEGAANGIVQRALSSGPAVYLGRVSYGTYLWHWPVVLVLAATFHTSTLSGIALACLVATGLASLSYEILERGVRASRLLDGHRGTVIAAGLAISVVSAVVFVPAILHRPAGVSEARAASAGTPIPKDLDLAHATFASLGRPPNCYGRPASACTLVRGTGKSVVLVGDSYAHMFIPTFVEIARRDNLTLSVFAVDGCPWQRHLYAFKDAAGCKRKKEDFYRRVLPALHPDLVVAASYRMDDPTIGFLPVYDEHNRPAVGGTTRFAHLTETTTKASSNQLTSRGADLVIIEPTPASTFDAAACLAHSRFLEQCRAVVPTDPTGLERMYRRIDRQSPRVWSADFDRLVCPYDPICDPVVAGHVVKVDGQHLTVEFARYIAPEVESYLKANRLIP